MITSRLIRMRARLAAAAGLLLCLQAIALADTLSTRTLTTDGTWCWFQDERAVMMKDALAVASITSTGTVQVSSYDFRTGAQMTVPLHEKFMVDDHNVPGMLRMDDGRLLAMYCRHGKDRKMHWRTTLAPDSIAQWSDEAVTDFGVPNPRDNFTYANPFQLSGEKGRIHFLFRAIGFCPTHTSSDDRGTSWADARQLIAFTGRNRPYAKYCTNHRDTIHIAYTEAHPSAYDNSIYHVYYRGGRLHGSDGSPISELRDSPIEATSGTCVYSCKTAGKGWIWDSALDAQGNPVLVYATVPKDTDHRYRYARWNPGTAQWEEREIARAGDALYPREKQYSGGICIDPDDTSVVYMSTSFDPVTGTATPMREIYRGATTDGGVTWKWAAVTSGSTEENLRPIVPEKHPGRTFVLWLRGRYTRYTDYHTAVVLASNAELP